MTDNLTQELSAKSPNDSQINVTDSISERLARLNELDARAKKCREEATANAKYDCTKFYAGKAEDAEYLLFAAASDAVALANKLHALYQNEKSAADTHHRIAEKYRALLVQAEKALATCRLFAGCEREYDAQLVEDSISALREAGIGGGERE